MEELVTIRCRGCRAAVGVGKRDLALYCSEYCATNQPVASEDEARDSFIEALARYKKYTPTQIAVRLDMTRQRVFQILQDRGVPREYS